MILFLNRIDHHCRYFGAFATLSPELCFVVEDDNSVVGFAAAAANAKELQRRIRVAWIPEMQSKYPHLFTCNESDTNSVIPAALKVIFKKVAWKNIQLRDAN